MSRKLRQALLALNFMLVWVCALPVQADSMSGVGDLVINTLDADTQKILAANGVLGANQSNNAKIVDCNDKAKNATVLFQRGMATVMTPADPVKKLNDGINACLKTIKDIADAVDLSSGLSFTELLTKILKQLRDKIIDEVVMKICTSATNAWNSTVNNAIDTLNTGINQSGVNTFGDFVSVSPAPAPAAPVFAGSVTKPSIIPGL